MERGFLGKAFSSLSTQLVSICFRLCINHLSDGNSYRVPGRILPPVLKVKPVIKIVRVFSLVMLHHGFQLIQGFGDPGLGCGCPVVFVPQLQNSLPGGEGQGLQQFMKVGPFMLRSYEKGVKIVFDRNPEYYMPGLPYLDGAVIEITPDAAARLSLLRAGKVDLPHMWGFLAPEEGQSLKQINPDMVVTPTLVTAQGMIYMRTDQPPFNDVRVRRALSLAIDRKGWNDTLLLGEGCVVSGPIPCAMKDWRLETSAKYLDGYDPAEARTRFAVCHKGDVSYVDSCSVHGTRLVPYSPGNSLLVTDLTVLGAGTSLFRMTSVNDSDAAYDLGLFKSDGKERAQILEAVTFVKDHDGAYEGRIRAMLDSTMS